MMVNFSSMHEFNLGKKQAGRQWNRLLDAVATIKKYKKIIIDNAIYIKVFFDGTVSFFKV